MAISVSTYDKAMER